MSDGTWHPTACILCECNCGIEVRLGGDDGRRFERIRGDKAHPASAGYTCEKALRLDHYQNGRHRLTSPLRRRADGTFEEIDWDTAIAEVAAGFAEVRDTHGGESIFYYGGGGQGNHLGGAYSAGTRARLGSRFRSNALAQEKTGEFWVNGKMLGTHVRGDFEDAEVALFVGKNPWQCHGFARARTTLKEIARDPARSMIVLDPRRTETAELADFHLQVRPGTDAWCLAALGAVLVEEDLVDHAVAGRPTPPRSTRSPPTSPRSTSPPTAPIAGVDEDLVRAGGPPAGRRQQRGRVRGPRRADVAALHAVELPREAAVAAHRQLRQARRAVRADQPRQHRRRRPAAAAGRRARARSPARGSSPASCPPTSSPRRSSPTTPTATGPCSSRAATRPTRSPTASGCARRCSSLELLVVIDVAMTETARLAHYVLPGAVAVREVGGDVLQLRLPAQRLPPPPPAARAAAGHARRAGDPRPAVRGARRVRRGRPRAAAGRGRGEPGRVRRRVLRGAGGQARARPLRAVLLYRTLGPTLPDGAAAAAVLWGAAHRCAQENPASVARGRLHRRGARGRRAAVRRHPRQPVRRRVLGRRARGRPGPAAHRRRQGPPRHPGAARRARRARHRAGARRVGRLPVRAVGRRAALVHRQHDLPRPVVAEARRAPGSLRISPADAERLGVVDGDARPGHDQARQRDGRGRGRTTSCSPATSRCPNGLGLDYPGEDGASGRHRRGAQRAHRQRGPRLDRRHAVAQARAGAARARSARA